MPNDDPTKPQPGPAGHTKGKPKEDGPKKNPPIDDGTGGNGKNGGGKKDGNGKNDGAKKDGNGKNGGPPNVVVNVNIRIPDGRDDGIKIGKWDKVDDPRDHGKAKKRTAWKRVQIHRTTSGNQWFVEEIVSDNGEILEVSITPVNPPNPQHIPGAPFKSLTKTRDALTLTDKDGKTHKYDAETKTYYPPAK